MKNARLKRWRARAVALGYGERGAQKLLDVLLDLSEDMEALCRKR